MAGAATVEKALDVLFHLHEAREPLGPSEIGRALDLPKSSCHRLLAALAGRELVERDALGRYRPGVALLALGIGAQHREPIVRAARPALEAEAAATGETVFLVARRGQSLRVLDQVAGTGFLRAAPGVGDVIPEDVTAAGKLHRAWASGDPQGAEDASVRAAGYALNRDAWIPGLSVLAAPVFEARPGARPGLAGVLALAAASARFEALGESTIARRLCAAAAGVSERLGVPAAARSSARPGMAVEPGASARPGMATEPGASARPGVVVAAGSSGSSGRSGAAGRPDAGSASEQSGGRADAPGSGMR